MRTVHIVGAGMAGLAAAVRLADAGRRVVVYRSAGQAGGRCRSLHDAVLDRPIDNGNHLLLGGNTDVFGLLDRIGARDRLIGADPVAFPSWICRPAKAGPCGPTSALSLGGCWCRRGGYPVRDGAIISGC